MEENGNKNFDSINKTEKELAKEAAAKEKELKRKTKQSTGKEAVGKSKLIVGLILIVAAILVAFFLVPFFANKQTIYYGLAAARDIAAGEQITDQNSAEFFKIIQTTDESIASTWLNPSETPATTFYGKYAQYAIRSGAYITKNDFDYKYNVVKVVVPEDKELVGVRVPSIEADVGYLPKAGDIIRFYGIENDPESVVVDKSGVLRAGYGKKAIIYELLQYVQIYRAVDTDGLTAGNGRQPVSIVLLCSTAQVKQLIEAQNNGLIYFSLISTDNPERAEECLALQENIEKEYIARNDTINSLGYQNISVDLSKITVYDQDVAADDYIKISVARGVEVEEINSKGEKVNKTQTELYSPDILSCILVKDVYDQNGISKRLSYANKPTFDIKKASLGLELTDEQAEVLAELIKDGSVIIQKVHYSEEDPLDVKQAIVTEAVRKARIEKTEQAQAQAEAEVESSAEAKAE